MKFRTVLRVIEQRYLTGSNSPATHLTTQERHDETRESQTALQTILHKVLITITLQSANGLISTAQLHAERLRAPEEIPVLIGQRRSGTQVTRRIRSLWLETQCRRLIGLDLYLHVDLGRIRRGLEINIGIPYGTQTAKMVIGILEAISRVWLTFRHHGVLTQHAVSQMNH